MHSYPGLTAGLGAPWVLVCRGTAWQHPVRCRTDLPCTEWRTRIKWHVVVP